jgi:hypothetical protein
MPSIYTEQDTRNISVANIGGRMVPIRSRDPHFGDIFHLEIPKGTLAVSQKLHRVDTVPLAHMGHMRSLFRRISELIMPDTGIAFNLHPRGTNIFVDDLDILHIFHTYFTVHRGKSDIHMQQPIRRIIIRDFRQDFNHPVILQRPMHTLQKEAHETIRFLFDPKYLGSAIRRKESEFGASKNDI